LTYAQQLLPITQDPQIEFVNSSYTYLYSLYEPLTNVDADGKLQPHMAVSWTMDTPTSWVFQLRQGMKWHDGSPVTSKDVVWSINRILDPETKSPWRPIISNVEGIEAVNDYAVRFKLKMTAVSMPSEVARLFVLPKDAYEKMGKDAFVRQVKGEMITVEAYEEYYAGAPKIKTLVFKQVPDAATRAAEVLAGTADVADAISPTDIPRIKSSSNAEMLIFPTVRRVLLNMAIDTTPELADKRVRQAIAHAIDRDAINQAVYDGLGGKQTGWFDRFTYGYNQSLQPYAFDPAKSKALLAEAGYPNGMPLTYMVGKGRFLGDEDIALAVTDYLTKAGFQVDLKIQEFAVFQAARARREYRGIYMLSSGNSLGDPDQVLRSLDSKRESIYVKDPALDALIDKQRGELDDARRRAAIAEVDKYIHENAIDLNLFTVPGFYAVSKRVSDWRPSPFEIHTFYGASVK
jgi:peptide/nickel transport system substrate-binding protein